MAHTLFDRNGKFALGQRTLALPGSCCHPGHRRGDCSDLPAAQQFRQLAAVCDHAGRARRCGAHSSEQRHRQSGDDYTGGQLCVRRHRVAFMRLQQPRPGRSAMRHDRRPSVPERCRPGGRQPRGRQGAVTEGSRRAGVFQPDLRTQCRPAQTRHRLAGDCGYGQECPRPGEDADWPGPGNGAAA